MTSDSGTQSFANWPPPELTQILSCGSFSFNTPNWYVNFDLPDSDGHVTDFSTRTSSSMEISLCVNGPTLGYSNKMANVPQLINS